MHSIPRGHDAAFKAKVALKAVKGEEILAQRSSQFGIHANQIRQWRKQLLEELPRLFSNRWRKEDEIGKNFCPNYNSRLASSGWNWNG